MSATTARRVVARGIVTFLFGLVTWPLRGWVIAWYWNWFMAESFGLAPFSIAHGLAFFSVVGAATLASSRAYEKNHSNLYYTSMNVLLYLIAWVMGWLWHAIWVALNVPQMFGMVPS